MYLPTESIMPFLNRLGDAISTFRIAFDYFALDLANFAGLADEFGEGERVAAYPEDWRETLELYCYCVLETG